MSRLIPREHMHVEFTHAWWVYKVAHVALNDPHTQRPTQSLMQRRMNMSHGCCAEAISDLLRVQVLHLLRCQFGDTNRAQRRDDVQFDMLPIALHCARIQVQCDSV